MTHFYPLCFYDSEHSVEDVLAPFDENTEVPQYIEYTRKELVDYYRKTRSQWANISKDAEYTDKLKKILAKNDDEIYATAVADYEDENVDDDGNILSTYNPISKWDWYMHNGAFYPEDTEDAKPIEDIDAWRAIVKHRLELVKIVKKWMSDNGLTDSIKTESLWRDEKVSADDLIYYLHMYRGSREDWDDDANPALTDAVRRLDESDALRNETIETPYVPSVMVFPLETPGLSYAITAGGMLDGSNEPSDGIVKTMGKIESEQPSVWVESSQIGWFAMSGEEDDELYYETVLKYLEDASDDLKAEVMNCHI